MKLPDRIRAIELDAKLAGELTGGAVSVGIGVIMGDRASSTDYSGWEEPCGDVEDI